MTYRWWMVRVDPLKIEDIKKIKSTLKKRQEWRNYLLFSLWVNSALRISDLLKIKVWDVFDTDGNIVEAFRIREKKTSKDNSVYINDSIKKALVYYKEAFPKIVESPEKYLFFRKKGFDRERGSEAITPCTARRLVKKRSAREWVKWVIGCYSMRKGFGLYCRMQGVDISLLQHKFRHSAPSITKKYLGITEKQVETFCMKVNL